MKSENNFFEFSHFNEKIIRSKITKRAGETKLGERLTYDFKNTHCKYVVLGIAEDVGPQANQGAKGAFNAFPSFLGRFLNTQSNRFLSGNEICVLGEITQLHSFTNLDQARSGVEILDQFVQKIIEPIFAADKIPIVIGGGHNNAFPLISAAWSVDNKALDILNLDPHADCRPLEGRHSGNPFSYAADKGFIHRYSVLGLHQPYNSEALLCFLDQHRYYYTFFEDYLDGKRNLKKDLKEIFKERKKDVYLGIEIDLDCMAYVPTSAYTPSGFSVEVVRKYIRELARQKNIKYVHLPEGSPKMESEEKIVGKLLVYLVLDFIKENSSTKE
jgi:formiminoglutamase